MLLTLKYCALLLLLLLAICGVTDAQPSSSTYTAIRLYDKNGRVKPERFVKEYEMYDGMHHGSVGSPLTLTYNMTYNKKDSLYYFGLSAIYPPYALRICHLTDTMELILPDGYLAFEKLIFQPGHYCFLNPYHHKKDSLTKSGNYEPIYTRLRDIDWDNARRQCDTMFRR